MRLPSLDSYDYQGVRSTDAVLWGDDATEALDDLLALDLAALTDDLI